MTEDSVAPCSISGAPSHFCHPSGPRKALTAASSESTSTPMTNHNTIVGIMRGLFAALVAMSVVLSSSAHASAFGDHRVVASSADGHAMHLDGDHRDGSTKGKVAGVRASSSKKGHGDNGSLCKMQCDFSMIATISVPALGASPRTQISPSWHVASLPGDARAEIRPPRS